MVPPHPAPAAPGLISPKELHRRMALSPGPRLLDVRTPEEFAVGHLPMASNIPLDGLEPAALYRDGVLPADELVFLVCRTSNRARSAAAKFAAAGFSNTVVVEGGTLGWMAAALPVEIGPAGNGGGRGT